MDPLDHRIITDRNGVRGTSETARLSGAEASQLPVRLDDGRLALIPLDLLIAQDDGSYFFSASFSDFEHYAEGEIVEASKDDSLVIPIVEEELHVGKRKVETGRVRIAKTVHEEEKLVDVPLTEEEVEVRRVPVNRPVDGPVSVRYEGDTMIVPLVREELVVQKRLVLKEEIYITTKRRETHHQESVTLRSEEVTVERVDSQE